MLSPLRIRSLFSENEFVNDDYDVYSYKWYPHNSSHSTYQVDKPALHANILRRVAISSALIIILLKPNAIRCPNGRPSDAREETVLTEDCNGIYEEQADVKYASKEKHD